MSIYTDVVQENIAQEISRTKYVTKYVEGVERTVRFLRAKKGREKNQRMDYRERPSESSPQWANVLATTPDTEAPVDDIWGAAERLEAVRTITNAGACQVLIGWHTFTPEHSADPDATEWVVLVTSQPHHAEERVDAGVVRLAGQTLAVKGTKEFHDIQMPMDKAHLLDHINGGSLHFQADQLVREGDFWIASELRPPSTEMGGTVIAHARTNRILYRATTWEQSAGEVLVP